MKNRTEDAMIKAIQPVQQTCISKQAMLLSPCFMYDPAAYGLAAFGVTYPDSAAEKLQTLLDTTIQQLLRNGDSSSSLPPKWIN